MFRRRDRKSYGERVSDAFWPRGGWTRAARYVGHRLRRLPDPADKIARGIASGIFTCFTPLYGLHFVVSAGLAWLVGGNVLAALLATFFGNPLTFPIIAAVSVELGTWILGLPPVPLSRIVGSFSYASLEAWDNLRALFTDEVAEWRRLSDFFTHVFLPYFVGGLLPGTAAALVAYAVSRPLIGAYQKARLKRLKKRYERQQSLLRRTAAARRTGAVREGD